MEAKKDYDTAALLVSWTGYNRGEAIGGRKEREKLDKERGLHW